MNKKNKFNFKTVNAAGSIAYFNAIHLEEFAMLNKKGIFKKMVLFFFFFFYFVVAVLV